MNEGEIRRLLETLGQAISAGELKRVSACWEVPALFLSDETATVFTNPSEIENIMAQASESYRSRGIVSTRPEVEHIELLTEKLASVDVSWPSLDRLGNEQASEISHYILQLGKDGHAHIRVALTRTK
jgi:hypothetical protein